MKTSALTKITDIRLVDPRSFRQLFAEREEQLLKSFLHRRSQRLAAHPQCGPALASPFNLSCLSARRDLSVSSRKYFGTGSQRLARSRPKLNPEVFLTCDLKIKVFTNESESDLLFPVRAVAMNTTLPPSKPSSRNNLLHFNLFALMPEETVVFNALSGASCADQKNEA